jgi:hypothetical protein
MKTSQWAILAALGVAVLGVAMFVGMARLAASRSDGVTDESGMAAAMVATATGATLDLRDFRAIAIRGNWRVEVVRGSEWSVELSFPESLRDRISARVEGDQLVLGWKDKPWQVRKLSDAQPSARIEMPDLVAVNIAGAGDLDFSGFSGPRLQLSVSGAADVTGRDGRFDDLELRISGVGDFDLAEVSATNAAVELSGAGDVTLTMTGGLLSGRIAGAGRVAYRGEVSEQRIHVSGAGKVQRIERR